MFLRHIFLQATQLLSSNAQIRQKKKKKKATAK